MMIGPDEYPFQEFLSYIRFNLTKISGSSGSNNKCFIELTVSCRIADRRQLLGCMICHEHHTDLMSLPLHEVYFIMHWKMVHHLDLSNYWWGSTNCRSSNPIHIASEFSSSKVFQYLVELDDGGTVDNLLDANNDSIVHYACRGGNLDVIQFLLEYHSPLVASSSVSVNTSNKVPIQLLLEAGEEEVDNEIEEQGLPKQSGYCFLWTQRQWWC